MKNVRMTLLALAAPVSACVTRGSYESVPPQPPGYNFAYQAPHREEIGLIQVFDDGNHTYLQFTDPSSHLSIRADAAKPALPYRPGDRYITLDGVFDRLVLSDDQASATVMNTAATVVAATPEHYLESAPSPASHSVADSVDNAAAPIAAVGVPEAQQTMHANLRVGELNLEIAHLEDRIRRLTEQLAQARRGGEVPNLSLRSEFRIPRFVVYFDDNSNEARLDKAILSSLGAAARAANRIYLHGHTDAYVASAAGTELAIRRAVAVRQLLIAEEVAPARVRLFYRGAGNFMANNSTPEGKAQNRRVEIELRKW